MRKIEKKRLMENLPADIRVKQEMGQGGIVDPSELKNAMVKEKNKKCQPCFKS
jgi:hypothetical protein